MKKLLLTLLLPISAFSQITMGTSSGSNHQNFDALLNTGSVNDFFDNLTIPGWYSQRTTASITYAAGIGSSNVGGLYSYGSASASDRALGTIGSNNTSYGGNFAHGVQLVNNSGAPITEMAVSYKMEQWRCGGNTVPQTLTFWYKVLSTQMTNLMPGVFTGWTQVTALTGTSPINSMTAGALDGNLAANKEILSNIVLTGVNVPDGSYIMLKWDDPDHSGSDHGLSIDDVTVTWGCASSAIIAEASCGTYTSPSGNSYAGSGVYVDTINNNAACDSVITIDLTVTPSTVYYVDADLDTYGDGSDAGTNYCVDPGVGYSLNNQDCDDANNAINPAAAEVCDGLDNNCDGFDDNGVTFVDYYIDADLDGFGIGNAIAFCINPGLGYSILDGDCDDLESTVYPNATEICDGIDNDCDGTEDEGLVFNDYYVDADGDNFGTGNAVPFCQNPGIGYAIVNNDCDDTNPNAYPGATEIANNGTDENCDGTDNYIGIEENGNTTISVHPNPSTGLFTIDLGENAINASITCTDLNGKIIYTETLSSSSTVIDLSLVQNGTYLLKISTDNYSSIKRISVIH